MVVVSSIDPLNHLGVIGRPVPANQNSTNFNKHSISNNNFTQSPKIPLTLNGNSSKKHDVPNLYW